MSDRVISVALPLPFQAPFSYGLPERLNPPERGARVLVPFGKRRVVGIALGVPKEAPPAELKDILEIVDEEPLVTPPLLDLAAWVAEYYLAPPGECYRMIFPPEGVRASRAVARLIAREAVVAEDDLIRELREGPLPVSTLARRLGRDPTSHLARLRKAGVIAIEQEIGGPTFSEIRLAGLVEPEAEARGKAQKELIARLAAAGAAVPVADLVRDHPSWRKSLDALVERGVVRIRTERRERAPEALPLRALDERTLTAEQAAALAPVAEAVEARRFETFLLHGVTGSGKTELYFAAGEQALAAGRGVLILVPEIALTPILRRAATSRFGRTVTVLHSEMSPGERHDQWWRIRDGEAQLVIGARSAVFAPLSDLGLLVVDEEHESAYKQEESPRYHARDVAVMRGKLEGAPVVLGSATPSLESYTNASRGKYRLLTMPTRIGPRGLPSITVIDRRVALRSGDDPIITTPLLDALTGCLDRREQALLLLNRRGYATSLLCRECGTPAACPNCSVSLTVHGGGRVVDCHYCGHHTRTPPACEACKGEYLRLTGYGTEKVVEVLRGMLPRARIDRIDRDLASRRGAIAQRLAAFEDGAIDVLVGTQMIAKGHDFPRVTVVGVVDADVGLGMPDFRSAERSFQLLTQVAGRAGRAELAGEVLLQSHLPDHYALTLACAQDYGHFFEREMEFRRTMAYPPSGAVLNVLVRDRDVVRAAESARALAVRLREMAAGRYRVLGPAPAPLARLRQEHRFQVLLKGNRAAMREAVRRALIERYGEMRWGGVAVDVDPVSIM
jgi:primosomal protein N' (replication factor Y) (superfamily II helicase)